MRARKNIRDGTGAVPYKANVCVGTTPVVVRS